MSDLPSDSGESTCKLLKLGSALFFRRCIPAPLIFTTLVRTVLYKAGFVFTGVSPCVSQSVWTVTEKVLVRNWCNFVEMCVWWTLEVIRVTWSFVLRAMLNWHPWMRSIHMQQTLCGRVHISEMGASGRSLHATNTLGSKMMAVCSAPLGHSFFMFYFHHCFCLHTGPGTQATRWCAVEELLTV